MDPAGRRARRELVAAAVTLAAWVASKPMEWHGAVVLAAFVAWTAYGLSTLAREPKVLARWGMADLRRGVAAHAGVTIAMVALVVAVALVRPQPLPGLPWWVWPLYVGWAFAQEFAVQAIVVSGLVALRWPDWAVVGVASVAFGSGHAPAWELAALAGAGGVAWTLLYLRHRNLWLVGASHAVVGVTALVLLLGDDPVAGFAFLLD